MKIPSTLVPPSAPRTAPSHLGQGLKEVQPSREHPARTTGLVTAMLLEAELDCHRERPGAPGASALCTFSRTPGKSHCNLQVSMPGRKKRRDRMQRGD